MTHSPRVLIVEARFYEDLADELYAGAAACLEEQGAAFDRVSVPGAFEIPGAIAIAAEAGRLDPSRAYDGFVGLGVVIRGETTHYDYVCGESARGLQDLAIRNHLAIGYGILTTENRDQAWARAARDKGDKGRAAATACLDMVRLKQRYGVS
jgi:6,7-dimethyl-8-ribityllumazine synthase